MARGKHKIRRGRLAERGTVSISGCAAAVGAAGLIFFTAVLLLSIRTASGIADILIFSGFDALSLLLLLSANWRIDFDSNGFTHRNLLRISRRYSWSDVTKIRLLRSGTETDTLICAGRRHILVDSFALGRHPFLRLLRIRCPKQYERALHRSRKA